MFKHTQVTVFVGSYKSTGVMGPARTNICSIKSASTTSDYDFWAYLKLILFLRKQTLLEPEAF